MTNEVDIKSPVIADDIHTALDVSQGGYISTTIAKLKLRMKAYDTAPHFLHPT